MLVVLCWLCCVFFSTLHAQALRIRGAGKRGRIESAVSDANMMFAPQASAEDPLRIQEALAIKNINFHGWVKSLTMEKRESLLQVLTHQGKTGELSKLINPYMVFIQEFAGLEVPPKHTTTTLQCTPRYPHKTGGFCRCTHEYTHSVPMSTPTVYP